MLSAKDNFLETIKIGGKPDRLVKQYEATVYLQIDPLTERMRGVRFRGMEPVKDAWGTTIVWPSNNISAMPHVTDETKVIKDITRWRDELTIPDVAAECSGDEFWAPYLERVGQLDRNNVLVMGHAPTGIFERLHHLMGFEDLFINLLTEPEAMSELCDEIAACRYAEFKLLCDYLKPDVIISQDDWGSKNNLFISPELWRRFIKPGYEKCYGLLKERGVIILHHADSFLEPIVEDMVDLGIDVWQGVIPQNDIPKLQEQLGGRMAMMGGIDSAIVDRSDSTEEEIRAEARRACEEYAKNGYFIPSITYGGPRTLHPDAYRLIDEEIERYNLEHF